MYKKKDSPHADQYFRLPNHNFHQHAKFALIEQPRNINIDKELAILQLKKRQDFLILKLKTPHPNGLYAELNSLSLSVSLSLSLFLFLSLFLAIYIYYIYIYYIYILYIYILYIYIYYIYIYNEMRIVLNFTALLCCPTVLIRYGN